MSVLFNITPLERIRNFLFLLFSLDILLGGPGFFVLHGQVSLRKLIFGLFGIFCILVFIAEKKTKTTQVMAIISTILFFIIWVLVIPIFTHGNLGHSISDALPLIGVSLLLVSYELSRRQATWENIKQIVHALLFVFAIIHIVLFSIFAILPETRLPVYFSLKSFYQSQEVVFAAFTPIENGLSRVYFGSSFLLLIGLYLSATRNLLSDRNFLKYLLIFIFCVAIYITNTRSLILGALIFGIFQFSFIYRLKIFNPSPTHFFLLLILPFILSLALIPTINPQVLRIIGIERGVSDEVRSNQFPSLVEEFISSPIVGKGFGSNAEFIVNPNAPFSYELSLAALLMKIGVLGLVIVLALISYSLKMICTMTKDKSILLPLLSLYGLFFSFIMVSFYSPFMFGFFGTFFLLFLGYEFSSITRRQNV